MLTAEVSERWETADFMGRRFMNRRCSFKVHRAAWNPFLDLLALASQKGEVCVRRPYWRYGWKRDVYDVKPLLLERVKTDGEIRLETICWSPNGHVLAVAFSDGCIHLLDAEKGIIRFTVRLKTPVAKMKWQFCGRVNTDLINDDACCGVLGDFSECESINDKSDELNQLRAMKAFCDSSLRFIYGTLLLTTDESGSAVHILAGGILPIAVISPPVQFFGHDPSSVRACDALYCKERNQLMVVYSGIGKLDTSVKRGAITQVVGYDIDSMGFLKNGVIWAVMYRWMQLVFYAYFVSEAFARAIVDWEARSKHFTENLSSFDEENAPNCYLGESFINMILTGHASSELLNFYRNVLKPMDWKKLTDWTDKSFCDLIENIGKELLPGARALQHHMKQLFNEAYCAFRSCKTEELLPRRLFDVAIYPYGKYADDDDEEIPVKELEKFQNLADDIVNKINEMHLIAVRNRKDLDSFMNWLSQTTPFMGKPKRSPSELKYDLQLIIEYIKQVTMAGIETKDEGNENENESEKPSTAVTVPNYSFDKISQFFDGHEPLKYRLDVSNNSWNLLSGRSWNKNLTDSINDCLDALQMIQDIILNNFSASVLTQKNTVLEKDHDDGFEKFSIFPLHNVAAARCSPIEKEWSEAVANEPYGISCIGVEGSRHIIYAASGDVLFSMSHCRKKPIEDPLIQQVSVENSENSEALAGDETATSPTNVQQSQKAGENVKGVDSAMPKSPSLAKLSRLEKRGFRSPIIRHLIAFEWYGSGLFYGLLKIYRVGREETLLFLCDILNNSTYIHEDASGYSESFCLFTTSMFRKLGVAFTENGFRAKCFDIQFVLHRPKIPFSIQKKEAENDGTTKNEALAVAATEEMDVSDIPRNEFILSIGSRGTERAQEAVRLRRSVRKRKPLT